MKASEVPAGVFPFGARFPSGWPRDGRAGVSLVRFWESLWGCRVGDQGWLGVGGGISLLHDADTGCGGTGGAVVDGEFPYLEVGGL